MTHCSNFCHSLLLLSALKEQCQVLLLTQLCETAWDSFAGVAALLLDPGRCLCRL